LGEAQAFRCSKDLAAVQRAVQTTCDLRRSHIATAGSVVRLH
jgi:hypothetical protein